MPNIIDFLAMRSFTADQASGLQGAPPDKFGATHYDIRLLEISMLQLVTT